jgi:hypothetical protein
MRIIGLYAPRTIDVKHYGPTKLTRIVVWGYCDLSPLSSLGCYGLLDNNISLGMMPYKERFIIGI